MIKNYTQIPARTAGAIRCGCQVLSSQSRSSPFYQGLGDLLRFTQNIVLWIAKMGGVVVLLLFTLQCRAEDVSSLAPPLSAAKEAGDDYFQNLEKMEKHLAASNLLEFYLEAGRLVKKINFVRNELRVGLYSLNGKEEIVACEWFSYYLAKSPFFPDVWLHDKDGYKEIDIKLKEFALECILFANLEKKAAFHKVEKGKLQTQYLSYTKVILKALHGIRLELEEVRKREIAKFREEEKTWPQGPFDEDERWRRKGIEGRVYGVATIRAIRSDLCVSVAEGHQRELLLLLMKEYPNNASSIHAFFIEIGYQKEELARRFQKLVGKDKKAAYLYQGLPKPKS